MFENQPKGLYALALANTGERFGYYTMLAIFVLFLQANFGWGEGLAGTVYATFLMLVYFLPIVGGAVADKIGFGKCVTFGILIMFIGYLLLSVPAGTGAIAVTIMAIALVLISMGTSLFKGNLQVMVGKLYDDQKYASQRDAGFSIFYMAINIGALFAPTAATKLHAWAMTALGASNATAYHYAFGVACLSLVISIAIYYGFRWTFAQVDNTAKKKDAVVEEKKEKVKKEETPEDKADTHSRLVALFLVFAVVIFFWMAFHQNGLTLTYFARDFTKTTAYGLVSMLFDVTNLLGVIVLVYALFALFQGKTAKGKTIAGIVILACAAFLGYKYSIQGHQTINVDVPLFQQFNPCFVVMLTPVSMALFGWLASKGKEPSAPRKIGYGMLVAAIGYVIMILASIGLSYHASYPADDPQRVSPMWLVCTYLVLTFAELLLSPMGISFVSKVAPQKYQGLMMGCWFGATAIGNFLVQIPAYLWNNVPLTCVWAVFVVLCFASFIFIFSVMKKLEKVC